MLRRAAVSWERDHQREYFYGSAGRSCERAVWEQSAMGEFAQNTGTAFASSLLDLTKAYEKVAHILL
eukprot:9242013-Pyramimonas_sp.AAC.1